MDAGDGQSVPLNKEHRMNYTLNDDGTVTIHHPVRFNSHVRGEFQAILESQVDPTEEPELHEVITAVDDAPVVVFRKSSSTYEAHLTLGAVEAFAREVAYYLENHIEMRREGDNHPDITKTINGCRTALASANKVLVGAGMVEIHSYFQK
jgi:hypothetical protein